MPSPAFYATDFKVFDEQGFRARMGAIRARIRPKLEAVGHSLTPAVSRATGGDAYAHVAKHARRTVNPPEDTWVAFGPDARGYSTATLRWPSRAAPSASSSRWGRSTPTRSAGRPPGSGTRRGSPPSSAA